MISFAFLGFDMHLQYESSLSFIYHLGPSIQLLTSLNHLFKRFTATKELLKGPLGYQFSLIH